MKRLFITVLSTISLYSADLIHVSNSIDKNSLTFLADKYKQSIIIDANRAFIVPQECKVLRYFGGLSQNRLNLPKSSVYTAPIVVTQEVFEAKDVNEIEDQIKKNKLIDKIEGKSPESFLEDTDGHLFGGLSQNPINLTKQKKIMKNVTKKEYPTCQLLDDGSGYKISKSIAPIEFINYELVPITEGIVVFK